MTVFRWIIGMLIVAAGVAILLSNLGYATVSVWWIIATYWPVLVILWGLSSMANAFRRDRLAWGEVIIGGIILLLGLAFLGRNLGWFFLNFSLFWRAFWPLIIILVGVTLLRGAAGSKSGTQWAFMSGLNLGKHAWDLKSGSFVAIMGGIDLDLTRARLPEDETVLDFTAIMGGVSIKVPPGIAVVCDGWVLLGGLGFMGEDAGGIVATKRMEQRPESSVKTVHIVSRAIMGGIDVKRVG